ncbi:MAG: LacI family DNA-binding transcriptional regulator [Planctomycetes bacterium]|nr:LacI family DNA-binding transcriptional regulator [Planctomycetota bacterium]
MTKKYSSVDDIATLVRGQIRDLGPGDRLDSIRTIAERIGSSPLTVSRAITQLAEAGEVVTHPGRGTFVSGPQQGPGHNKSSIGLLINSPRTDKLQDNPLFTAALPAVQFSLFNGGQQSGMIRAVGYDSDSEDFIQPEQISSMDFLGVMAFGITDLAYYMRLSDSIANLVALDIDVSDFGIPSIAFDHMQSSILLVEQLKRMGRKNIHFIGGPFPAPRKKPRWFYDSCSRERFDGFRSAMFMHGFDNIEENSHFIGWRAGNHYQVQVARLIDKKIPLDAIVTEAPGAVCAALKKCGVPDNEVCVAGWGALDPHNNNNETDLDGADVLTAALDFAEMGKAGAEMMQRLLDDPQAPCERKLIPALIIGSQRPALLEKKQ